MTTGDFRILDADAHVIEPPDLFGDARGAAST